MEKMNFKPEEEIDESLVPRSGDRVFYWNGGDAGGGKPVPATVLIDADHQRTLALELHLPGGIAYSYACKHLSVAAHERDRERNGGWSWNRTYTKPVPAVIKSET